MTRSEARIFDIDTSGDHLALKESIPLRGSIKDIGGVATALYEVAEGVREAHIPNTQFSPVYGRLSERISDNIDSYDRPDDLNKTSGIFLDAYLEPLRDYADAVLSGDEKKLQEIPEHWRLALFDPRVRDILPVFQFKLGMDAHINYDLVPVLAESGVDDRYYDDYTYKVGDEIKATSDELAPELLPGHQTLGKIVLPLVTRAIAHNREISWNAAMDFMTAEEAGDEAAQNAILQKAESDTVRQNKRTLEWSYRATKIAQFAGRILPINTPWNRAP